MPENKLPEEFKSIDEIRKFWDTTTLVVFPRLQSVFLSLFSLTPSSSADQKTAFSPPSRSLGGG
jgi:hypothetical protein